MPKISLPVHSLSWLLGCMPHKPASPALATACYSTGPPAAFRLAPGLEAAIKSKWQLWFWLDGDKCNGNANKQVQHHGCFPTSQPGQRLRPRAPIADFFPAGMFCPAWCSQFQRCFPGRWLRLPWGADPIGAVFLHTLLTQA